MPRAHVRWIAPSIVCIALSVIFFVIPAKNLNVFLSPDETAVAVEARNLASNGILRLADPIVTSFPWLHPRSFVTNGTALVPVGFLGLPLILGLIFKVLGSWGMLLFTPLLALSAAYPIWKFSSRFGRAGQYAATICWLTFPTVILYANRGLFPNVPCLVFTVWAAYLIWKNQSFRSFLAAGVLAGLAIAIRPTETVWIFPWLIIAWLYRENRLPCQNRKIILSAIFAALTCLSAVYFAWQTYGSALAVGYFLHDPAPQSTVQTVTAVTPADLLPFGFHPRLMILNSELYLGGFLWPWTLLTLLAALFNFKRGKNPIVWLGVWTLGVLCLVYGQARYQDHVGVNVISSGNSFLRYLLPLAPFYSLSAAWLVQMLRRRQNMYVRTILPVLCLVLLVGFGWWTAVWRDDEGIATASSELVRYSEIRRAAKAAFPQGAVVLSERSDKIFFPDFRAASPLPADPEIQNLIVGFSQPILYFGTKLDEKTLSEWRERGLYPSSVFVSGNQALYRISP